MCTEETAVLAAESGWSPASENAFERFPEVIPALAAKTALGRVGEPDDIGMVIATLLSEDSRWITAQNIEVAGGYNL
ncbi:SDR family oxidoreductase [Streptomyces sp. NPDC002668]|uniref:SDR family oxidoreductase n=1 Tax=Streptomyces sp. NPDC002668 TaxID=3154422 RepID=UPI00332A0A33